MGEDGGMLSGQWLTLDGKSYYLCKDGRMARDCYVRGEKQLEPGAWIYYWVNGKGEWLPQWDTTDPDLGRYALADAEYT